MESLDCPGHLQRWVGRGVSLVLFGNGYLLIEMAEAAGRADYLLWL